MNELLKTVAFVAVALLLTGAAVVTTRDRTVRNEAFNDQGQPFFPVFEPLTCTDLEVVDFEPTTATATRFRVMYKDNKWVIPSHYDYPADARDRLSKTAAAVMDLVKDTIRSDRVEDQEGMGVIDPLDTSTSTLKGRGKRITLRGTGENVLADFIIGNEIKDKTGQRFVRVPGQKRTYGVKVKAEPSTKFADWIETNLLKLEASRIRKIEFDNYKVRFDQGFNRGEVVRGEVLTIERKDSGANWTMAGLSADQELDSDKLRTLTDALADLKIVGVRTKPPGLTRDLKSSDASAIKLTAAAALSLQSKGFYLTREGLLSNQGDVRVYTDEGVIYTLRFGEVVVGSGDELTAGTPDDVEKKAEDKAAKGTDKDKDKAKQSEGSGVNRFVMATAAFDAGLIPPPKTDQEKDKSKETEKPVAQPGQALEVPVNPFAPDPNDPKVLADEKAAKEKAEQEKKDYEKKLADGKKRAQELTDRFAAWYYVSPGESFRSINLDRAALVKPKKADSATAPGSTPSFPGSTPSLPNTLPPIQP
jgi:hypothetical protein